MVALMLAMLACQCEVPENFKAFKAECEKVRATEVARIQDEIANLKKRLRAATNQKDQSAAIAGIKKQNELLAQTKRRVWHEFPVKINTKKVGSIGQFYEPAPNNMRVAVRFRADLIQDGRVIGVVIIDGQPPKTQAVEVGKDIKVIRDKNSKAGRATETPAVISGVADEWEQGKTATLSGIYVITKTSERGIEFDKFIPE